jgi:hypothetical protein
MATYASSTRGTLVGDATTAECARRQLVLAPLAVVVAVLLSFYAFRDGQAVDSRDHASAATAAVSAPVFERYSGADYLRVASLTMKERR